MFVSFIPSGPFHQVARVVRSATNFIPSRAFATRWLFADGKPHSLPVVVRLLHARLVPLVCPTGFSVHLQRWLRRCVSFVLAFRQFASERFRSAVCIPVPFQFAFDALWKLRCLLLSQILFDCSFRLPLKMSFCEALLRHASVSTGHCQADSDCLCVNTDSLLLTSAQERLAFGSDCRSLSFADRFRKSVLP